MTYINDDEWKGKDVFVLYLVRSDEDDHPSEKSLKKSERKKLEKEGKYKKYLTNTTFWSGYVDAKKK